MARYRDDPAFLGYYLGDEPPAELFPRLGEWFEILRERDPAHPAWNSLRPRWCFATHAEFQAYLQHYVAATQPAVLCNNQYDFLVSGDRAQLTENIATLGAVARANGLPFWGIVQLVEHWRYRHVTDGHAALADRAVARLGRARHRLLHLLDARADSPDTTGSPAMIEWGTGERTPNYDMVTALERAPGAARQHARGHAVARDRARGLGAARRRAVHPRLGARRGRGPGDAGLLRGLDAASVYLFVANADSLSPRTVTLTLAGGRPPSRMRDGRLALGPLPVDAGRARGARPSAPATSRCCGFPAAPPGAVGRPRAGRRDRSACGPRPIRRAAPSASR